jgi:2-iminobutanoate/2-iminopropanoate deaminase
MERRIINPWSWQDEFSYVQAHEVSGTRHVPFCAGQASVDEEGKPVHTGDMGAQITQAFDNLETVLRDAKLGLLDVVR